MSAKGQKRTHAPQQFRRDSAETNLELVLDGFLFATNRFDGRALLIQQAESFGLQN
jgi:hypothetical protein